MEKDLAVIQNKRFEEKGNKYKLEPKLINLLKRLQLSEKISVSQIKRQVIQYTTLVVSIIGLIDLHPEAAKLRELFTEELQNILKTGK